MNCAKKFGATLRDLRQARNEADYDMGAHVDARKSQLYYSKARSAFDEFVALTPSEIERIVSCIQHVVYTPRSR